jgi:hypothetical protein
MLAAEDGLGRLGSDGKDINLECDSLEKRHRALVRRQETWEKLTEELLNAKKANAALTDEIGRLKAGQDAIIENVGDILESALLERDKRLACHMEEIRGKLASFEKRHSGHSEMSGVFRPNETVGERQNPVVLGPQQAKQRLAASRAMERIRSNRKYPGPLASSNKKRKLGRPGNSFARKHRCKPSREIPQSDDDDDEFEEPDSPSDGDDN